MSRSDLSLLIDMYDLQSTSSRRLVAPYLRYRLNLALLVGANPAGFCSGQVTRMASRQAEMMHQMSKPRRQPALAADILHRISFLTLSSLCFIFH